MHKSNCRGASSASTAASSPRNDSLVNHAQVHNPEKLDNIDAFLDEAGPGNEEVLLEAIQDKYGVPRS